MTDPPFPVPMPCRISRTALAAVLLLASASASAQDQDSVRAGVTCEESCHRKRPWLAIAEVLGTNVFVNRFDAWALGASFADVSLDSWSSNIKLGWEWDENAFGTNMFAHPYHGGLYFNAGRSNGLTFWESAPLAFLGSWTWEYLGETHRPALNDFFMTSFGGIALGEVFHRVATTIRSNTSRGSGRIGRELAALPLDPLGAVNRLVRGEWTKVGPNPREHDSAAYVFRFHMGVRFIGDSAGPEQDPSASPALMADMSYGAPFDRPYHAPFDYFSVRLQISPGGGGFNMLNAVGRLYGSDINSANSKHRHLFMINQRYDYVNNPAYKFGAQSVEAGIVSRWRLGGWHLRTKLTGDGLILGAIDAPFSGVGERTYDFGPGAGLTADIRLERRGIPLLSWYNRFEYLHSVSGASADHFIGLSGLELTVPIARNVGVGAFLTGYARASRYSDAPNDDRDLPEAWLFITWTSANDIARMFTK